MREDYKLQGTLLKLDVEIEKEVAEKILQMESFTKLTRAELINTALKRFIAQHSDFLPKKSH
jgi:hypothetical protein